MHANGLKMFALLVKPHEKINKPSNMFALNEIAFQTSENNTYL